MRWRCAALALVWGFCALLGAEASELRLEGQLIQGGLVRGQVAPGIPCWVLGGEARFPGVPYVIFPGNVVTPKTLAEVITMLRGA